MPTPDPAAVLTAAFIACLVAGTTLKIVLALRQIRHLGRHRHEVPEQFRARIPLAAHQRAAAYGSARARFGIVDTLVSAATVVVFTLLGGLDHVARLLAAHVASPFWLQMALVGVVALLLGIVALPLDVYRQFVLDQRFGFNRMTAALFITDLVRSTVLTTVVGGVLLACILALIAALPVLWWLAVWALLCAFSIAAQIVFPRWIAPLFNRFEPLPDGAVRSRVEALMQRCGFASDGLFVMDGSRRSAHANAYFTGFGRSRRIVFFDTLLQRLDADQIEAVLAHELGHFRLRHIVQRTVAGFAQTLLALALLAWLMHQPWFYGGLGVDLLPTHPAAPAAALLLAALCLPVFTFLTRPLMARWSRRQEFQADAFAAQHTDPRHLVRALVTLYEDNASTLTPDPVHSAWYDSHPPASVRIARLLAAAGPAT